MNTIRHITHIFLNQLSQYQERQTLGKAIKSAYTTFAQQHPRLADSLFDDYLLQHEIISHTSRPEQGITLPAPGTLAQAWTEQLSYFNPETKRRHIAALTPVAATFISLLEEELRPHKVARGLAEPAT